MNVRVVTLSLCLMCCHSFLISQDIPSQVDIRTKTYFFEALGRGGLYSFGFDKLIRTKKKVKNSWSIGAGFVPYTPKFNGRILSLPSSYNFIYGSSIHHLELGTGLTFSMNQYINTSRRNFRVNGTEHYLFFIPSVGYRLQTKRGFFLRVSGDLFVNIWCRNSAKEYSFFDDHNYLESQLLPWFGLGIGFTLFDY